MKTSSGIYDLTKLRLVRSQLRRAYRSASTLIAGMEEVDVTELEITGDAELQRGLDGLNAFGDNGHKALRKLILAADKATPDAGDLPPDSSRKVGESAKANRGSKHGKR